MASIRKAKKLGLYKKPKQDKELLRETRKLVEKANRRLKGLKSAGYQGSWASRKLSDRLDTKVLKAWNKTGKIKVNKNLTNTQLLAIQKATNQFLTSSTSTAKGIKSVKDKTMESLKATLSKDKELSNLEVETAYEMLANKDFDYFNNEDRVGASTMWALIEDAIEFNQKESTFINRVLNMYESSNDLDAKERLKRLYEVYVK